MRTGESAGGGASYQPDETARDVVDHLAEPLSAAAEVVGPPSAMASMPDATGPRPDADAAADAGDDATAEDAAAALARVVNLDEFTELARARMDAAAFDYVMGGSWDEITLRDNSDAFRRRRLRPRVLVDVSRIDTSTDILGTRVSMPIALAPTAFHRFAHPDGELATARAAAEAGVLFCLATMSSYSIEDVAAAAAGRRWFQLYVHKDRGLSRDLVRRAAAAGYSALILTVDLPVAGYRERDLRNRLPAPSAFGNLEGTVGDGMEFLDLIRGFNDQTLAWRDIAGIRETAPELPLVIKGIMTGEDAALAVDHGAAAVVVSNHGGRQLDRVRATIDVLEEVVAAVGGRAEVYLDGGVRRGTDVLVALGLGARAVFIGRPYLMALGAGGGAGVAHALRLVRAELETAMALLGVTAPSLVTRSHVA